MKLKLQNLVKYSRFIKGVCQPVNQFYESLYMDFEEKMVYFFNDTCQGRIKFEYEGDKIKNFFIKESLFTNILNISPIIDYENHKFMINNDVFQIPKFGDEDNNLDEFPKRDFDNFVDKVDINLNDNLLNTIKNVFPIIPLNDPAKKNLQGVFLRDGKLIVTDRLRFIDLSLKDNKENTQLSYNILKFLNMLDGSEKVELYFNGEVYKFIIDDILEILVSSPNNISLVGSNGVELDLNKFRESIKKDTYFEINKSDFKDTINVLKIFASNLSRDEIYFEINDNNVSFILNDNVNKIYSKKNCNYVKISDELKNYKFKTCFSFISDLLNVFQVEKAYKFCIDLNPDVKTFTIIDSDNDQNMLTIKKLS